MSEQWTGKTCPECFEGTLKHGIKKTRFEYRGKALEYDQAGAWCNRCYEGVMTGNEALSTEARLDEFISRVDKEEAAELARIRRKLKLTQKEAARITGGGH